MEADVARGGSDGGGEIWRWRWMRMEADGGGWRRMEMKVGAYN